MSDCSCDDGVILIYRGEDRDLLLSCEKEDGKPFNLTGASAAVATIPGEVSPVTKSLGSGITITDAAAGALTLALAPADTNLLKLGDRQTFSLAITIAAKVRVFKFRQALSVEAAT